MLLRKVREFLILQGFKSYGLYWYEAKEGETLVSVGISTYDEIVEEGVQKPTLPRLLALLKSKVCRITIFSNNHTEPKVFKALKEMFVWSFAGEEPEALGKHRVTQYKWVLKP